MLGTLNAPRANVLETPEPDLGPSLAIALARLAERHGAGELVRLLGRLGETA